MFRKVFKHYVELEVRKGIQGGGYTVAKVKVASLPKKDLGGVLADLREITETVPAVPARGRYYIPVGSAAVVS